MLFRSASGTLVVSPALATISLNGLAQLFDGTPRIVTATTVPPGLPLAIAYDGSPTAPTAAGSYAVVATVTDPNFTGSASGTLVVTLAACNDGLDDDGDGFVDTADPGCANAADLSENDPTLPCDDGIDNDGDSRIDFRTDASGDPGCRLAMSDFENPACDDGLDNDGDGKIDWDGGPGMVTPDPECTVAYRNKETPSGSRGCGLGAELVGVLPLIGWFRRRRRGNASAR